MFEHAPLERLAADGQLMAYQHDSFWQCMDTLRDKHAAARSCGTAGDRPGRPGSETHMRVLVTGHKGYIGTVLVPHAARARTTRCRARQRPLSRAARSTGELAQTFRSQSRTSATSTVEGPRRATTPIIHLAGLSNDPLGDYDPSLTDEINARASVRLAQLAKHAGVRRFVFASSCSNYGASGDKFLDEGAAFNPVTPYGESKVQRRARGRAARGRERSARPSCAPRRPTACRRASASTWCSTT